MYLLAKYYESCKLLDLTLFCGKELDLVELYNFLRYIIVFSFKISLLKQKKMSLKILSK